MVDRDLPTYESRDQKPDDWQAGVAQQPSTVCDWLRGFRSRSHWSIPRPTRPSSSAPRPPWVCSREESICELSLLENPL